MIRIESIAIEVDADGMPFRGDVSFAPGLNLVSADNGFGKSLACTAIAWCLRLEPLFGVGNDSPRFFKSAVTRELLDAGGVGRKVRSSRATLRVARTTDGRVAELSRSIHGGDPSRIRVVERVEGSVVSDATLNASAKSVQDEVGGFQAFLARFVGLPAREVMRTTGQPAPLYFENLAPFFLIEQMIGWTDVAATQVHRYRLVDVNASAVEYLLGADDCLASRVRGQVASARDAALRAEARALRGEVDATLARHGWAVELSDRGSPAQVAARWSAIDLKSTLLDRHAVDFASERARYDLAIDRARSTLAGASVEGAPPVERASRQLQDLKERRESAVARAAELRLQHQGTSSTLADLEARLRSTRDLVRLKREGVGILARSECPMCHQDVTPERFHLDAHGFERAELQVAALERDVAVLKQALARGVRGLERALAETRRVEDELRQARRALQSVVAAQGENAETLAKAAHDLADAETARERSVLHEREIDALQARVRAWVEKAAATSPTAIILGDDEARIAGFADWLRADLRAMGHTEVIQGSEGVTLDEDYRPVLSGRELRALGAGSDPARLVLAYSTALLRSALDHGGHHPGVLIADEPRQQNPDKRHELLAASFWKDLAPWLAANGGQVIVFTSLRPEERARLTDAGVPVQALTDAKLLRPVRALPAPP